MTSVYLFGCVLKQLDSAFVLDYKMEKSNIGRSRACSSHVIITTYQREKGSSYLPILMIFSKNATSPCSWLKELPQKH